MSTYLKGTLEEKAHYCESCKMRKEPHEVFFSTFLKAYICKDGARCKPKQKKSGGAFNKDMEKEVTGKRWNGAETKD